MVALSKTIFKAYDIRGIIDKTLDAGIARHIGRAFGAAALAFFKQERLTGYCCCSILRHLVSIRQ